MKQSPPNDDPFGVKMLSGKVIWVIADDVDCVDGALLFYRGEGDDEQVVAGFNLEKVEHFGKPDAFRTPAQPS
jgi:hypothetical protein